MEPESEDGTRVVQSESWNEMLNLVIDADDNRELAGACAFRNVSIWTTDASIYLGTRS